MYIVPGELDDDLFSMLATVSDQRVACSIHPEGVYPVLITNDKFRDYKQQMTAEQSLFKEWYARHCYKHVNYSSLEHIPNNVFDRRIRCHDWSNGKEEDIDESDFEGKVWHFPVNKWGFDERFAVRIPRPRDPT